jgi:hypothetical protein
MIHTLKLLFECFDIDTKEFRISQITIAQKTVHPKKKKHFGTVSCWTILIRPLDPLSTLLSKRVCWMLNYILNDFYLIGGGPDGVLVVRLLLAVRLEQLCRGLQAERQ